MRPVLSVVALLAGMLVLAGAEGLARGAIGAATQPDAEQIRSLISELLGVDAQRSSGAQDQLTAAGDPAEAALLAILDQEGLSAVSRRRIETVLGRIDNGRVVAPPQVTLKYQSADALQIYTDLAVQSKLHLAPTTEKLLQDLKHPRIDFEVDNVTPWQALLQLNQRCNLHFDSLDAAGMVTLRQVDGKQPPAPVATSGPILATLSRIEVNYGRSIDFAAPQTAMPRNLGLNDAVCRLYCFTWCNPGLKPLAWFVDSVDACVTDTGVNLQPNRFMFGTTPSGGINSRNESVLSLHGPLGNSSRITKLKMTTTFMFERKRQTLDIPDVMTVHEKTYQLGDVRVTFKGLHHREDGQLYIDFMIFRDKRDPSEWEHMKMLYRDAKKCKLLDADGNSYRFGAYGITYSGDIMTLRCTVTTENPNGVKVGAPFRFLWSCPATVERVTMPLEFTDIELPK